MENKHAVTLFAALAQESRLAIVRLLVEHGPAGLPVGQIAEQLDLAAATLSFHLKELYRAGLLQARPQGRFIYYSVDFSTVAALLSFMTENCCTAASSPCCPPSPPT